MHPKAVAIFEAERASMERRPQNDLASWYPLLLATGAPTPRTIIVRARHDLERLLDGGPDATYADGILDDHRAFVARMTKAAEVFGFPCFLRTGHGADKHSYRRTCRLECADNIESHVMALVEWSACASLVSLPTATWAVREWLDLDAAFTAFDGLPIATEVRAFIGGGAMRCWHGYWPVTALTGRTEISDPAWRAHLARARRTAEREQKEWRPMVETIAAAFGSWSVDLCRTRKGVWYVTDMARAEDSYHGPCKRKL